MKTLQKQLRQQLGCSHTRSGYDNGGQPARTSAKQAVGWANALIEACPRDLRTGLRPFLTHFTSDGHTTEVMTAHASRILWPALQS